MLDVIETCLYATDLDAAERFYRDVLGLEPFTKIEGRHVFYRMERGVFLLFNPEQTEIAGDRPIPVHGSRGEGHVAFRATEAELVAWKTRLTKAGVVIETEYEWPNGGRSIYFRDPAGNSLEFTTPKTWGFDS